MPVCTFTEVAWGTTMVLNRADECRQRADECRRSAAQLVADDMLRGAYLDLARRWRKMAQKAQQKELGPSYSPAIIRSTARIAQGINKLLACAALNPRAPQTANGNIPEAT